MEDDTEKDLSTAPVYDELDFEVPEDHVEEYLKCSADYKKRCKKLKTKWDSLIKKNKWNLVIDSGDLKTIVTRDELVKDSMFRYLVFRGIPSEYRNSIWMILSGGLQLRVSEAPGYYERMYREREREEREFFAQNGAHTPVYTQIELDLVRTFLKNKKFSKETTQEGIDPLRRVLLAYAHRNVEIGYCQSMNMLAGWLLLTLRSEESAFWILCAIAENVCPNYYTHNMIGCQIDIRILKDLLDESFPKLVAQFEREKLSLPLLASKWFLCIYADMMPSATTVRVWDSFFLHGTLILFRVAVAIIELFESKYEEKSVEYAVCVFQSMPATIYDHKALFKIVRSLTTISHKRINSLYEKYDTEIVNETLALSRNKDVQALLNLSTFTREDLMHMWDKFTMKEGLATKGGKPAINFEQFQELISHASPEIRPGSKYVAFLFKIFDRDRDGVVGFREWVNGFSTIFFGSIEDKMRHMFRCYNKLDDDCLLESELVEMLRDIYSLNGKETEKNAKDIAHEMFLNAKTTTTEYGEEGASFSQFYSFIHVEPLVYENLAFDILLMSGDGSSPSRATRRMSVPLQKMIVKRMSFVFNTTPLAQLQQMDDGAEDSKEVKNQLNSLREIGSVTSSSMTSSGKSTLKRKPPPPSPASSSSSSVNAPLLMHEDGVSSSSSSGGGDDDEITPEPNFTFWDLTVKRFLAFLSCGCC